MLRLTAIGFIGALALMNCSSDETEPQAGSCTDPPCDDTCANPPCDDTCANPPCDDTCADPPCDDTCADPPCEPPNLAFVLVPVTIDDPIVNGTSLMTPVDGVSYAYDSAGTLVTAFGRDFNDPSVTFLWHVDEATGTHAKTNLTGQAFADGANFCLDEDWCQYLGYDAGQWVVIGAAANEMMRVNSDFSASLSAVSGPRPAASLIDHTHRFAAGKLFLFGSLGPAGFGETVHMLTLSSGVWQQAATSLPQTHDNCIAFDASSNTLFSLSGRTTNDGGNTTLPLASFTTIDIDASTFTTADLPAAIGARRGMSCAFDEQRGLLYAFGGAVIDDNFNDALNTFFNDLWVWDVAAGTWTNVVMNGAGGTLLAPDMYGDQRFEGEATGPNFGKNRGHMQLDANGDRLLLIGSVPVFTQEQLFVLSLEGIEQLL